MAFTLTNTQATTSIRQSVAGVGTALMGALVRIGENSRYGRQIDALNALSDAELAARGTNRRQEVAKIFGPGMYI